MTEQLNRQTFTTNRSLEFFSEKELSMQIGHSRRYWPAAILKELVDNALDACETARILPEIRITVDHEYFTVADNGPGISEKVLLDSLDYLIRVSDKNFYVSPSRGQLGNALKCLYAFSFVMSGDTGRVSTKGMSVTAMRELVAQMSAKDVTVLVLHDFDKAGFSIVNTLRTDTRRWSYDKEPNVFDLGFRLEDVEGLETEEVFYNSKVDPRINLMKSGATKEEAKFLRSDGRQKYWEGRRVELNAMTSKQLIDWLEKKLQEHGVKKVVPDEDVLKKAYISSCKAVKIRKEGQKIVSQFDEEIQIPDDLKSQIEKSISGTALSWDAAIKDIAFQNRPTQRVI